MTWKKKVTCYHKIIFQPNPPEAEKPKVDSESEEETESDLGTTYLLTGNKNLQATIDWALSDSPWLQIIIHLALPIFYECDNINFCLNNCYRAWWPWW